MDLNDAVAELYRTGPDSFLERRRELVVAARAAKDRDAVKAVGALRRPTVAAWLVNLLQRDADGGPELVALAHLGGRLRESQLALQADRMRELGRERRRRVADLVSRAVDLAESAGHVVSAAVEREIDETLVAAVADEAAADAVLSGSLTRALSYAGFGEVDLELAVAMPLAAADPEPEDPGPTAEELRRAAEHEAHVRELQAAMQTADSALTEARDEASQATARLAEAHSAAVAADAAVVDLVTQLDAAREAAAASTAAERVAQADATTAESRHREADAEVERLRRDLMGSP